MTKNQLFVVVAAAFILSCSPGNPDTNQGPAGSLFIIGGGKRPPEMVRAMLELSGADSSGYIVVLPMASEEPDSSYYYAAKQFREQGADSILLMVSGKPGLSEEKLDVLRRASLIYITGGAQDRFMDSVRNTNVFAAIHEAYRGGTMIAGTSAGAAVQSKFMITGDQFKHPEYTGNFETIEADNIELEQGLGLISSIVVDQHFIKRQRLNRLISVVLEKPGITGVGIDEATAIYVKSGMAKVYGESQVVVIENPSDSVQVQNGLLGGKGMKLSIYLPGEHFILK